ncbi:hypothetical protein [Oerskovia enterophila]|uniref:hypothetical protein n=1 Tax=Oerskovia enterophila TaxID=43678 RepID=UPI003398AFBB
MPRQRIAALGATHPLRALSALVRLARADGPGDVANRATLCRVCAWDLEEPGWTLDGPTHAICDCCGAESGVEDTTPERIIAYRRRWTRGGHVWFDPSRMPEGWYYDDELPYDTQDRWHATTLPG